MRWIFLGAAAVILYQSFAGPGALFKLAELRAQEREQRRRLDSLNSRQQELEIEKQRLLADSAYLEKAARKELGMARPGEKVYRLVAPPAR